MKEKLREETRFLTQINTRYLSNSCIKGYRYTQTLIHYHKCSNQNFTVYLQELLNVQYISNSITNLLLSVSNELRGERFVCTSTWE